MLETKDIKKLQGISLDVLSKNKLAPVFAALADENRYKIYSLLFLIKELCVTDIATILDISLPLASQHLRILEQAELIMKERMGQMICYMLNHNHPFNLHMKRILKVENNY